MHEVLGQGEDFVHKSSARAGRGLRTQHVVKTQNQTNFFYTTGSATNFTSVSEREMASHGENVVYAVPLADDVKYGNAHDMHCGTCTCRCKGVLWRVSVVVLVLALAGLTYAVVMQYNRLDALGAQMEKISCDNSSGELVRAPH